MPYLMTDLIVNRVDLVDEGADSAAFVELYKRKELSIDMQYEEIVKSLKPEHQATVLAEVAKAKTDGIAEGVAKGAADLALVQAQLTEAVEKAKKTEECKAKENEPFDETQVLKSMPEPARAAYIKMRDDKAAVEKRLADEEAAKLQATAVAKAATFKAIPVAQEKLVAVIKSANPETLEVLDAVSKALEAGLGEVGKNKGNGASSATSTDSWAQIEKAATDLRTADPKLTKEQAVAKAITANPELYRKYREEEA